MDRRTFLGGLAAGLSLPWAGSALGESEEGTTAVSPAAGPAVSPSAGPVAVSSANGLEAVRIAYERMLAGADPTDAAVEGVKTVELDPRDYTVGYGGLPNFDGVVELDAAVMHGPSGKGGAVASLRGVKTPSEVARLVMERTDHVLLVGEGARRFATMHGFGDENLLTDFSRKLWLFWRENLSAVDDWVEPPPDKLDPEIREFFERNPGMFRPPEPRPTGTIHLSAIDGNGNVGCTTTTSGLFFKVPGRVGDSPLIGCGLYCDNDVGSAGGTGRGEAAILSNAAHTVVELMRRGESPEQACLSTLQRVVHLTRDPLLKGPDGRPNFNLRLYAANKAGACGSAAIWSGGQYAVADRRGARHEEQAYLYKTPTKS